MDEHRERLLTEWMDAYGNDILRLCYTYVHSWQTAEDLTQETFIKLYRHYTDFRGEAQIKTYIYAIAINVCKDYISSWKYKKVLISTSFQQLLKTKETTESAVVLQSEKEQLVAKIEQLAPKYKDVILLFYYADYSLQEISEVLGLPVNTVKTRLKRAREQLKGLLEDGEISHAGY